MGKKDKNSLIIIYLTIAAILVILLINIFAVDVIKLGNIETWEIPDSDNLNVSINKNLLCVDIADNENPYYIYAGEGLIENSEIYKFNTNTNYYVDFTGVKTTGNVSASFWIIEYQNNNKINSSTAYLSEGDARTLKINFNNHVDSYRFAVRLIGTGSFQIKSIRISKFNYSIITKNILIILLISIFLLIIKKHYEKKDRLQICVTKHFNNIIINIIYYIIMYFAFAFVLWLVCRNNSLIGLSKNITTILFFLMLAISILLYKRIININISHIIILSIAIRLIWCFTIRTIPVSDFSTFWTITQKVVSGNISIFASKSPIVPFLYSFILKVFNSLYTVYAINSLVGGLQVLIIFKIAKILSDDEILAISAAILYALYPASIMYTSVFSSETIMITCILIATYTTIIMVKKDDNIKKKLVITILLSGVIGITLGFAYMARTVSLVFIVSILLYILLLNESKVKTKILNLCFVMIFFIISLLPLLHYNYYQHGEISLSTYPAGGYVLLFGTCYETDGGYSKAEIETIIEENELSERMTNLDSYEKTKMISEYATQKAIARIMDNPIEFLRFAFNEKFDRIWENEKIYSFTVNGSNLYENEIDSKKMNKLFLNSYNYYSLLWIFSLFGIISSLFYKDKNKAFLSSSIIGVALLHIFFEVQPRYHLVVMPFTCILASTGLTTIANIFIMKYKKFITFMQSIINKKG